MAARSSEGTKRVGFSLVEFLIVISVLGILLAVTTPLFAGLRARAAVNEGANQFARDVERQRQEARRETSVTQLIDIEVDGSQYTLVATDGTETPRTLPNGVAFGAADVDTIRFTGPYGTVDPVNPATVFTVVWGRDANVAVDVAVVGVLGKAIVR